MLRAAGLSKSFSGRPALSGVDLSLAPGEVLGIVGENGAGKSTLVNLVSGALIPDAGEMEWGGRPFHPRSPREAADAGIGVVHQHFALVPRFCAAENLALAAGVPFRIRKEELRARARDLAVRWSIALPDPSVPVEDLSVGERQRIEILKALARRTKLLLLDEPTAVLSPEEVEEFLRVVRALRKAGVACVFIDHKLDHVLAVADRIVCLRRGRIVVEARASETDAKKLARAMVGEDVVEPSRPPTPADAPVVLQTHGLRTAEEHGSVALRGVDLSARKGEVTGIAGVDGNGQRELCEVLLGLRAFIAGSVRLAGELQRPLVRPEEVAAVPPDRRREGLALPLPVFENLCIDRARLRALSRFGLLRVGSMRAFARELLLRFRVDCPSEESAAGELSGGNQQKLVVARALSSKPSLLVACNPTRGLDVGATAAVHRELLEFVTRGGALLLVSTDLDEVLSLSHRIHVMNGGTCTGPFDAESTPDLRAKVGEAMAGRGGP